MDCLSPGDRMGSVDIWRPYLLILWPQVIAVASVLLVVVISLLQARYCGLQWKGSYCRFCWIMMTVAVAGVVATLLFLPREYWYTPPGCVDLRIPPRAKIVAAYGWNSYTSSRDTPGATERRQPFFRNRRETGWDDLWFNRRGMGRLQGLNIGKSDSELERIVDAENMVCLLGPSICVYEHAGKTNAIGLGVFHNPPIITLLLFDHADNGWRVTRRSRERRDPEDEVFGRSYPSISTVVTLVVVPVALLFFLFAANRRVTTRSRGAVPRHLVVIMSVSAFFLLLGVQWSPVPWCNVRMAGWFVVSHVDAGMVWIQWKRLVCFVLMSLVGPVAGGVVAYSVYRVAVWRERRWRQASNG
jgi:hypothetical protein